MRKMKDSGIDWIQEIPSNWDIYKVKKAFIRKDAKAEQDNPVVLSLARDGVKIRDISNNEGQLAESYYNYNPVEPGDLLLNPMDLYSGANCSISKVTGVISPAYMNLRAKEGFNPVYYDYYFKTQYWGMALFAHGKGVSFDNRWTLGRESLMNYYIPHPTYEEQTRIADFLDKKVSEIDAVISKTKESIEECKKLKQSIITEAVTKGLDRNAEMKETGDVKIGEIPKCWDYIKLKYIIETLNSGSSITAEDLSDNGYPVYGGGERIGYYDKYNTENTLVIGRVGARCGCITKIEGKAWATDNALIVSTRFPLDYLRYILESANLNDLNTSNAQPLITSGKILNLKVPLCFKKEQQEQLVKFLDAKCLKYDALISKKEEVLSELEQFKKSLIYEYVTGKKEVA